MTRSLGKRYDTDRAERIITDHYTFVIICYINCYNGRSVVCNPISWSDSYNDRSLLTATILVSDFISIIQTFKENF